MTPCSKLRIFLISLVVLVFLCMNLEPWKQKEDEEKMQLGFLHLPKCAGTSIEAWGLAHGINWGKYDTSMRGNKKTSGCNSWHTPQKLNQQRKSFCVARDPFDRIVSEFRHRACQRKHANELSCDLTSFSIWLNASLQQPLTANDCHFLPQVFYFQFCDYILLYNRLQADFSDLILRHWPTQISHNDTLLHFVVQPSPEAAAATCNRSCFFEKHQLPPDLIAAFDSKYADDIRAWQSLQSRRYLNTSSTFLRR